MVHKTTRPEGVEGANPSSGTKMTPEYLAEIKERCSKATIGPWFNGPVLVGKVNYSSDPDFEPAIPEGSCYQCIENPGLGFTCIKKDGMVYHLHVYPDYGSFSEPWREITSVQAKTVVGNYNYEEGGVASTKDDSDFIAHSRKDIPALLEYISELEEKLKSLAAQ